jgi:hypothetical protein
MKKAAKKTARKTTRRHAFDAAFARWLDDVPVAEAKDPLTLIPNQPEINKGVQGHPTMCAWALACGRM